MATPSQGENPHRHLLELITEFYCTLSIKKDMHNITSEIRQFVIMRDDIKKKEETAKRILDFFLRLESQLVGKTNKQWDQVFEILTAQGQALLKMCDFPKMHGLTWAFRRLKNPETDPRTEKSTIMLQMNKNQEEITIEVEKDIKLMTYYFFKWGQYTEYSKTLRQLKKKQVQNEKISQSFNKYGLKSNCFNGWKILYKKSKLEAEKSKIIEARSKDRVLRACLSTIEEVAAIIAIQADLSRKVGEKILMLRKKEIYRKLRSNMRIVRFRAQGQKKFKNPLVGIFMEHFTTRIKASMNKSYRLARARQIQDSNTNLASKYFTKLKNLYLESHKKSSQILNLKKKSFLHYWQTTTHSSSTFSDKAQKLLNFLSYRRRRVTLTVLTLNNLLGREQFKELENFVKNKENSVTRDSLGVVERRREIQGKRVQVRAGWEKKGRLGFVGRLLRCKQLSEDRFVLQSKLKCLLAKTLSNRYRLYLQKRDQRQQFLSKLKNRNQRGLCVSAFARWRRLKHYRKYEQASLSSIDRYSRKIVMMSFWNKFVYRACQKSCLQRLISSGESMLVKMAFSRIARKTLAINQSVQGIKQTKNKKLMRNLFNLFVRNQKYNSKVAQNIEKCFVRRCERVLMKKLKQIHLSRNRSNTLKQLLQRNRAREFLVKLEDKSQANSTLRAKMSKVSKTAFLTYFKKSIRQNLKLEQEVSIKSERLQIRLRELAVKHFIGELKYCRKIQRTIEEKTGRIVFKLCRTQILKLKDHIAVMKRESQYRGSYGKVVKKRQLDAYKILLLKQKSKSLTSQLNSLKKQKAFADFVELSKARAKLSAGLESFHTFKESKQRREFLSSLIANKLEIDQKSQKVHERHQKNLQNKCTVLYSLLRSNKENIIGEHRLTLARKQGLLSEFVALNLKVKFGVIKYHCSLKAYARNIMKKAFKSLKLTRNRLKQKENNLRLDRTSSIMIQKSIQKSFKSSSLSEQIQKFNLRRSRQQIR